MGNVLLFPGFTGGIESGLPVQPVTNTGCTKLDSPFPVHDPPPLYLSRPSYVGQLICLKPRRGREVGEIHQAKDLFISVWYRA